MDVLDQLFELFVVASVAALTPVISALIPRVPVPQVVILIVGGIVIGPVGLGVDDSQAIQLIANVGLGFVFLLAGFEIDPVLLAARPGRLALLGWLISAVAACGAVGALAAVGYVHAFVPVALALTTTALGTVLPILRENQMSGGQFGRLFLAAGAVGELLPILAIAIFLGVNSRLSALISIVAIGVVAVGLAASQRLLQGGRLAGIVSSGADSTGQTTLRFSILLLLGLLVLAGEFGLDVVLGAFLAGAVLRRWAPGDTHALESKLDAVGYGFFIPVFFVSAGMALDVHSILDSPARLVVFLLLLLSVRGLPTLVIYRKDLAIRQRTQLMLCTATSLPMIVALTQIGLASDTMRPENAAALVGAGVLSVLLFPLAAVLLKEPGAG
jgi:Kef-type K+ transport system membrane component KefB